MQVDCDTCFWVCLFVSGLMLWFGWLIDYVCAGLFACNIASLFVGCIDWLLAFQFDDLLAHLSVCCHQHMCMIPCCILISGTMLHPYVTFARNQCCACCLHDWFVWLLDVWLDCVVACVWLLDCGCVDVLIPWLVCL